MLEPLEDSGEFQQALECWGLVAHDLLDQQYRFLLEPLEDSGEFRWTLECWGLLAHNLVDWWYWFHHMLLLVGLKPENYLWAALSSTA
jgi:hypothetical protein